jgi:nitrate reductase (NAD(P)H)
MRAATLPVLLASAGNRRKELRAMTPPDGGDGVVGDGGDWGAGAVGNSLWTGVPLRDVLKRAGVTRETPTRRHVHLYGLESVDDDGAGREYGVSIPLRKALDPAQDVLVAYAQNGETLTPDHGYPVRAIVPGDVGGNSIKWLSRVEVRETPLLIESAHARTRDNVFPPHVTTEKIAEKERWWTNPDVAMRELCVNSVVCAPAHGDCVKITPREANAPFAIRGYAHSGGGRAVTRVEVSLDGGVTWRCARVTCPCPRTAHGKQWCWAMWSIDVARGALARCREITARAWDEAHNTQPRDVTWNLLGCGNNAHFRVKTEVVEIEGCQWVTFEHPTEPGDGAGGWMGGARNGWSQRVDALYAPRAGETPSGENGVGDVNRREVRKIVAPPVRVAAKTASVAKTAVEDEPPKETGYRPPPAGAKIFSLAEIEKHDSEDDAWILVKDKVYDCTAYIASGAHPGGNASIVMNAGTDSTEDFEAVHSAKAWKQLDPFLIGYLDPADNPDATIADVTIAPASDPAVVAKPPPPSTPPPVAGPVNLLQFALANPEMYGEGTLVGEAAEAAAFDRMWAGARNDAGDAPRALDPKKWLQLRCDAKVPLSHDTILLRLALETPMHQCGLPVGYHLYLRGVSPATGKKVMRAYTPSSLNGTLGAVEFVIKIYFPNDNPMFPEGGQLTRYLNSVNVGDFVEVKGPMGHIQYHGRGMLTVDKTTIKVDRMTMIGGGTGVAPMLQMIVAVLSNPDDETKIKFLFGNKSEKDILLRYTLDRLRREHPDRFEIAYTISKAETTAWTGLTGRVNKAMIKEHCFAADESGALRTVALLCGPPSMEEDTAIPALKELGYAAEDIVRY